MQGMYFEQLEIGQRLTSPRRTITEADIVLFTRLSGLVNPLFTDDLFAREKGFSTRVAPGPLTLCFALGLTDDIAYGTASAALEIDKVKFIRPVRPGDTIWVTTTVTEKRESRSRPEQGPVTLSHEVYNQDGNMVCTFARTVMFFKKQ